LSLEFLNGKSNQPRWQVNRVLTLIGSTSPCKVRLRSSRIAPFHCSLVWTARGAWIVDLLGEEGVRLNGIPAPFAALEHGDRLQIGEFVIRVCCGATSSAARGTGALAKITKRAEDRSIANGPAAGHPYQEAAMNGRQVLPAQPPDPAALPFFPANLESDLLQSSSAMGLQPLALPEGGIDPAHAALVPLISQFGAMQEQMADQFRQTLMMMFQMFSALHKDQMAFFRQEMDRVQQLTQELHLLQIEAARHSQDPGTPAPPVETARPLQATSPAPAVEAARYSRAASPGPPRPPAPPTSSQAPQAAPPAAVAAAPQPPSPGLPPSPQPSVTESGTSPGAPAGQDIHVWLCQRMAAVQEERQNRWQKLLGLLSGKRAEEN